MSDPQTAADLPAEAEPKPPARLTLELETDEHGLRLEALVKTLTAWRRSLAAVEREITGEKRARLRWRVVELSLDGKVAKITIEEGRP